MKGQDRAVRQALPGFLHFSVGKKLRCVIFSIIIKLLFKAK